MAKRVTWIVAAVLFIAFGTLLFVASSHTVLAVYPEVHLFVAVLLLAVAVIVRRPARPLARVLLLCGAAGLVVACAHDTFIELGMRHQWFQTFGDGWVFYGYLEGRERPYLGIAAEVFRILGFCFPLGLLLLALQREAKPSNKAMQRTAGRGRVLAFDDFHTSPAATLALASGR
ncbi:MAG: hypothetical protein ACREFF_07450 [Candidatus Udaeobacter sp.]